MDESAAPSIPPTKPVRRSKILAALDAELPNWLADGPLVPDAANLVALPRWVLTFPFRLPMCWRPIVNIPTVQNTSTYYDGAADVSIQRGNV